MLKQLFLQKLEEPQRLQFEAAPALEELLHGFWETIREVWPALSLGAEEFMAHLARLASERPPDASLFSWLEGLFAADLYLACACSQQQPEAITAFEERYGGLLRKLVQRYASHQHLAEDLLQTLREKLFVGSATSPPKIEKYGGQGPLHNWLRVTAIGAFLDCVRVGAQQKKEFGNHEETLEQIPDHILDVELEFLKREYRGHFKEAFAEALASLAVAERNLLRQHLVAGLSIDQIGAIYHVHRATAARRLARARESLFAATQQALTRRLQISSTEFESLMGLIRSRLEVSLHRLLQSQSPPR